VSAPREGAGRIERALPPGVGVLPASAKHEGRPLRLPLCRRRVRSRLQDVGRPDVPKAGRRDRELDEAVRAVPMSRSSHPTGFRATPTLIVTGAVMLAMMLLMTRRF
jgi:hypothetical protein